MLRTWKHIGARPHLLLQWLVSSFLWVLVTSGPSFGAFDESVHWQDFSEEDLHSELRTRFSSDQNLFEPKVSFSSIEIALADSDSMIAPEFRVPKDLRSAVRFWMRVYTEFTTRHVVIFDERHPDLVYEVLDFRELARTARGPIAYEVTVRKKVNQAVKAYEAAFRYLAKHPYASKLPNGRDQEIKNIRAVLAKTKHKHSFAQLRENLRTQTGQRDNVIKGLAAAEAFFPKMEDIFKKVGVPVELTRLPLVESSFNLRAKSRAGAAGIWQFMRRSGSEFLLIENRDSIDERLSPLKSTVAAALLLKETFHRFRSWPLTVTAYNHGLRGLAHMKRDKTQDFSKIAHLFDPCKPNSPLGWAGRNYYAEFLAVLHAETYRKFFYGVPPSQGTNPVLYRKLDKPISPLVLAKNSKVSAETFRSLNPDIQNLGRPLPKGFLVALPSETEDLSGLTHIGRRKTRGPTKIALTKGSRKRSKPTKT